MIVPTGNYVLIQPDAPEEKTEGGIIVAKIKTPTTGEVLRVSEDAEASVTVGDRVQYLPNKRIENEDGTILLSEESILFVFN